jgi:hypothetical protein
MILRVALIGLLAAMPARAAVTTSTADGFVSVNEAVVPAAPASVWSSLLAWDRWWPVAHSYSGKPGLMRLDPRAGGGLSENWDGKSVWHASVVTVMPPKLLRLNGGFGPLQAFPVEAVLDISLTSEGASTRVRMSYRVGGPAFVRLDAMATPVDAVMSEGFGRLVRFATTGSPE